MRAFTCPSCGGLLFFENSVCLNCHTEVGYDRATRDFVTKWRPNAVSSIVRGATEL